MHKLFTFYSSSRQSTCSILVLVFNKSPKTCTIATVKRVRLKGHVCIPEAVFTLLIKQNKAA